MTQTFSVTKISEKTKRTQGWDMISPMAMRAHQVRRLAATFGITVFEIRALLENLLQPHIMTRDRKRSVHIARYEMVWTAWTGMGWDGMEWPGTWSAVIAALSQSVGANLHGVIGHGASSLSLALSLRVPCQSFSCAGFSDAK